MQQALDTAKLQDGYVGYPWERRMQNSSSFLSILFLPFQPSESDDHSSSPSRYNDIDDTLARANAWLNASQSSGVPILFSNIQTESLLTKVLSLRWSDFEQIDDTWFQILSRTNHSLTEVDFYGTFFSLKSEDIELMAKNCPLVSLLMDEIYPSNIVKVFELTNLERFYGGCSDPTHGYYPAITESSAPFIHDIGFGELEVEDMRLYFPIANLLKKLDLRTPYISGKDLQDMFWRCPNLEEIETHKGIGDGGLVMLARTCRKLVKLVIMEHHDGDFEDFPVTQRGLIAIASGCRLLEHLSIYVDDITNGALECMGAHLSQLSYFRMVILYRKRVEKLLDLPLDKGVTSLMMGCKELVRFDFYFGVGRSLSDAGLASIGDHGHNLRRVLLGSIGSSDAGLIAFANGCPKLEKLTMKGASNQFSCRALAEVARKMGSLKYARLQGYFDSLEATEFVLVSQRYWNLDDVHAELIIPVDELVLATPAEASEKYDGFTWGINEKPSLRRNTKQLLAYRSLSTKFRDDYRGARKAYVVPIWPPS